MSNKNKQRLSLRGDQSAPTTAPIEQVQAAPSAPTQEKTMEAVQEVVQEVSPETLKVAEASEPTAKVMAAMEEANASRARQLVERQAEAAAEAAREPVSIIGLAAQGREVLLDELRKHAERAKPKEYVPPPRTERQMSALQEELEAGRRVQQRAEAQQKARVPAPEDRAKEGFTTPVYRPGDVVPDPTIPSASGAAAGTRTFGADAP